MTFFSQISATSSGPNLFHQNQTFQADIDAMFVRQILNLPKKKWEMDIHHHSQTNDFGARLEVAKRAAFYYFKTLIAHPARLKRFCSDSAMGRDRDI
ncbi:MAG: hypothetical protein ACI9RO_002184 [Alteromonas macleodii]|jgi:hypothetical protein